LTSLSGAELKNYFNKELKENDVTTLTAAIWTTRTPIISKQYLTRLTEPLRGLSGTNILLSIEDIGFLNYENLNILNALRLFSVTLTWNYKNALAGGAYTDEGISKFGFYVLDYLRDKKITVDTAHLSANSFYDFVKVNTRPILNSHTCFSKINKHCRNVDEEQIKIIKQSGGFIGLSLVPQFLTDEKNCTVKDLFRHIDYFAQNFGIDNIGIGSDFYGSDCVEGLGDYYGFESLGSELSSNGYKEDDIDKIFYKNYCNFVDRI
jgi:membrane dipeptidase